MKIFFLIIVFMNSIFLFSQETNYWFQNFGAISSLKGGIESGGIYNPAAIYYNPGALAFMNRDFFDSQLDVFSLEVLNIENAAGDGIDLNSILLDVSPSIFVYSKRLNKYNKLAYSLGVLTRYNSNLSFDINHEETGNYLLPNDRLDIFQGQYHYDNRIREGWFMGALSYLINNKIGLGISTNLFIRSVDYNRTYKARAFPKDELDSNGQFSKITSSDDVQKLNYRVMGFVFKPGINIDLSPLKLGLTLTTPSLTFRLLSNHAFKSQLSILPDEDQKVYNQTNSHSLYTGVYKTPFSVNIGAEYQFHKVFVAFSAEWFSKIKKYNLIKENKKSKKMQYPITDDPDYAIPVMANKSVVNFGFSVVYNIKESLNYIGSFRTDLNFFDNKSLNRNTDFVPNMSYLDIYHITSGIVFSIKKANITFGMDYGYGRSKNDQQFVNMTSASQSNFLKGNINRSTSTVYHNISLNIGLNFNLTKENNK